VASDWIKIRNDLDDDPHVLRMQAILKIEDGDLLIGKLRRLWAYGDRHTTDGFIPFADAVMVDQIARLPGIAAALKGVGWLDLDDRGAQIVRFSDHNGNSAKRRCEDQRRKRLGRNADTLRTTCGQTADKLRTKSGPEKKREEEIREEVGGKPPTTPAEPSQNGGLFGPKTTAPAPSKKDSFVDEIPAALNTPEFVAAWRAWEAHRKEIKHPLTPTAVKQQFKRVAAWGVARAVAALELSTANGWTGIHESNNGIEPKGGRHARTPNTGQRFAE
jgi:hypothetical protein